MASETLRTPEVHHGGFSPEWLRCLGSTEIGELAAGWRSATDQILGTGNYLSTTGRRFSGSKARDTGLLPRKVGKNKQSALCSHFSGLGPTSPALSFREPQAWEGAHQDEWHGYWPLLLVSRHSGLNRTASPAGWLGRLWRQQPRAEEPGLPAPLKKKWPLKPIVLPARILRTSRVTWVFLVHC